MAGDAKTAVRLTEGLPWQYFHSAKPYQEVQPASHASDDNQRSRRARPTSASSGRTTRRLVSTQQTPRRPRCRSTRRSSTGRGVRGACSGALGGASSKRPTGAARHRSNGRRTSFGAAPAAPRHKRNGAHRRYWWPVKSSHAARILASGVEQQRLALVTTSGRALHSLSHRHLCSRGRQSRYGRGTRGPGVGRV